MPEQAQYQVALAPLLLDALHSPGLLSPNGFKLARYSLDAGVRNRLLDPDISALEDYLIDHSALPGAGGEVSNLALLHAFGDSVYDLCHSLDLPLQLSYQNLLWLLMWLNLHHPPSFFGEDPDSPLQMLQMAAALGLGEWAAAFNQIEEGVTLLLELANSPLWRVRAAAALGMQRLLGRAWASTVRRLRYHAMMGNPAEWRVMLLSVSEGTVIGQDEARVLDALELQQAALRFYLQLDAKRQSAPEGLALREALERVMGAVAVLLPGLGFAQLRLWAQWHHPEVKAILRANVEQLAEAWAGEAAALLACLDA